MAVRLAIGAPSGFRIAGRGSRQLAQLKIDTSSSKMTDASPDAFHGSGWKEICGTDAHSGI